MITLNILILTMPSREKSLAKLVAKLEKQIKDAKLKDRVFVHINGNEGLEGTKRNQSLEEHDATYSQFVDDDDDVHDRFVPIIYNSLDEKFDCIGIKGIVDFRGVVQKGLVQSLQYTRYFEENGVYYRPPTHLNPIKTEIFRNYRFEDIGAGCDVKQSMNMQINKAIKTEFMIEEEGMYIYKYDSTKVYGQN